MRQGTLMKQQLIQLTALVLLIVTPLAINARTEKKGYTNLEKIKKKLFDRLSEERRTNITEHNRRVVENNGIQIEILYIPPRTNGTTIN